MAQSRKRKRTLSADDQRLWAKLCETVTPINPAPSPIIPANEHGDNDDSDLASVLPRFVPNARTPQKTQWPEPSPDLRNMAKSTQRAVNRGTISPDRLIDLHGDRYETARKRLIGFVIDASKSGDRVGLVITGKGGARISRGDDTEISGVIRRALPSWLADPAIAKLVSHYTTAHLRHGGDGAWYVFIRPKTRLERKKR